MKDFLMVSITSDACPNCHNIRGNGLINNDKEFMSQKKISSYLKGNYLININFRSMSNSSLSNINNFSEFKLKKNILYQFYYSPVEEEINGEKNIVTSVAIIKSFKGKNVDFKNETFKKNNKSLNWEDFKSSKIPQQIKNYSLYFPAFNFIPANSWNKSLKTNKDLIALTDLGENIFHNGEFKIKLTKEIMIKQQQEEQKKNMRKFNELYEGLIEDKINFHIFDKLKKNIKKDEENYNLVETYRGEILSL